MLATFFLLAQAAQAAPKLDDWVLRAERIVLARVERVIEVKQVAPSISESEWPHAKIRVAELRIERRFVGPATEETLFVAGPEFMGSRPDPVVAGERGLYFLGDLRPIAMYTSEGTRRELARATGGAFLHETLASLEPKRRGMARLSTGERISMELLEEFEAQGRAPELEPFLAQLEAGLGRTLPAIEASYVANGPGWGLRVGPDRKVIVGSRSETSLSEGELQALWNLAEETRFPELPLAIGRPLWPEDSCLALVLRNRDGPKSVALWRSPGEDETYAEESARFLRLWDALPGADKPSLTKPPGR